MPFPPTRTVRKFPVCAVACAFAVVIATGGLPSRALASEPADIDSKLPEIVAVRAGWAYGLGGELEFRPNRWGIGISGGYVPGYGAGGYLGVTWGAAPLGYSGPVAEFGLFRGVASPLRSAPTGWGAYALAGTEWSFAWPWSMRVVAGGGIPFTASPSWRHLEFLAKLTAGVAF